jgi:hypothetical protein
MKANRTFKTSAVLLLPLILACAPGQQGSGNTPHEADAPAALTTTDVISRAADNWGGMERVDALQTLRAQFTYHEADGPVTHDVGRPNLVRSTGGERYISVFDGHRAAFVVYMDREGNSRDPFIVEEEEVKDWEMEKAWVFPAFFDHPAEYLGLQQLEETPAHVLRVMLPLGARMDYFLDAESFLVIRAEGLATIGETTYESAREYFDFELTDGVLYPTRMTYFYGDGEPNPGTIGGLEIDSDFPPDHFLIPEDLR